ncbi:MAG: hypothetical protein HY644_14975 [Acidobacteria bacterium]|nr:hypothetical protein [Acidobacteriota bacterium]
MDYVFSDYAVSKLKRRGIEEQLARKIIDSPEQRLTARPGREVFQSIVVTEAGKRFLVRIFVDVHVKPARVVTRYRTSKIAKYWEKP